MKEKLCYVATVPAAVHVFLRVHIQAAVEDYDVTVICNSTDRHLLDDLAAHIIELPIQRKPSPFLDLLVLFRLFFLFRRYKFDIVHTIMPKTGLLGMWAAWLAMVPVRIHTFTGQVWVTKSGIKRLFLKIFDRLIISFSTCILTDSKSQQDFLVSEGILKRGKARLIGAGSICGVDAKRFHPDLVARETIRRELDLSPEIKVILFVGRLNRDKGILNLAYAFDAVARNNHQIALLVLGAEEEVRFDLIEDICCEVKERLRYVRFTSTPERYMAAADVLCLPSYREGFSMVVIEAAACGLPAVASRISGIIDAVKENETALLFAPDDASGLEKSLLTLISDDELRGRMGDAARLHVLEFFPTEHITHEMQVLYGVLSSNAKMACNCL
ncbi:glycosyltransferase [Herminiimonas sp. NPDC097707]|uniref:glycosyltransferase n=1 Tax=Herminiimonas sp. NPDC097707 TaxID=3364007 RepID=UPI00383BE3B5